MHTKQEKMEAFGRLLDVMDDLREKCPWDRKQTNESLRPNTIEETYELCDALMKEDNLNICKELGDVLLHVCFYARIPSLIKAYRIQDKARNVGFDWEERRDVWKKVKEEITEFEAEVETLYNNAETDEAKAAAKQHATEEFGDVMFSLINAARLYKINPDNALEHTNQKFIHRFNYVEAKAKEKGQDLKDLTLEQMDAWWEEAKHQSNCIASKN